MQSVQPGSQRRPPLQTAATSVAGTEQRPRPAICLGILALQFPGVATSYQPPCFWVSSDGGFVDGFSVRLTGFFFPGNSGPANQTATQWAANPDTLCHAPARRLGHPFLPVGPRRGQSEELYGLDADFIAIESSFTMTCSDAGIPFHTVNLAQQTVIQPGTSVQPDITTPTSAILQRSLSQGPLRGAVQQLPAPTCLPL
jgi:hypothetical protein